MLLSSTKLQLGYECAAERRTQSCVRAPRCAVSRPRFLVQLSLERRGFFMALDRKESNPPSVPSTTRRAKTPAERVMPPVVYQLPGMDDVIVQSNLKYSEVDNPFLLMDIYTPPSVSGKAASPVVVFVHGAAGAQYKPKDWGLFRSWGRLIAAAGMIAAVFT